MHRWQINVQKNGVRKTFTCVKEGRTGQRIANKKADEWLDDEARSPKAKVSEAWEKFLQSRQAVSDNEYKHAESFGRVHLLPYIGKKQLADVTEQDYQDILDRAYRNPGSDRQKTLSRKTLRNFKSIITQFVRFCKKSRYAAPDLYDLTIPEASRYVGKRVVTVEDFKTVFSDDEVTLRGVKCKDDFINYYRFQLLTGLRPGELRGLKWKNINGNICRIEGAINKDGVRTRGKNGNAIRSIVLSAPALEVLKAQKKLTGKRSYIFPMESMHTYYHRWQRYQEQHGMPSVSLYEMRHTFVSIAKSLPEGQLKQLVGHSEDMDTYGTYSHELSTDDAEIAANLETIFGKLLGDSVTEKKF